MILQCESSFTLKDDEDKGSSSQDGVNRLSGSRTCFWIKVQQAQEIAPSRETGKSTVQRKPFGWTITRYLSLRNSTLRQHRTS